MGNGGLIEPLCDYIREGLQVIGLDELSALFAELEAFARTEPERFARCDWTDPTIHALDQRFGALPRDEYFARHADWIRGWPNLRVLPGAQWSAVVKQITEKNLTRRRWWQGWHSRVRFEIRRRHVQASGSSNLVRSLLRYIWTHPARHPFHPEVAP